ncbi:MAG: hypothetical protein K2Q18_16750 [Bdellovibrionales bacterium]|nr:hypothetical protein [Bdellovibrionales bacterium]
MKKIIFILSLIMTFSAFGEIAKTSVGAFSGTIKVDTAKLEMKTVSVIVTNQFCNFAGSTCAGGPSETKEIPLIVEAKEDGKFVTLTSEQEFKVRTSKIGRRFSSCKISLYVEALNSEGKLLSGKEYLAFENSSEVCENKEEMTRKVQENLNKSFSVEDGGIFIRIKE